MNCPACKQAMVEKDFGGVKVDICSSGCKGIWFDWCELVKLDEKNEGMGKALTEALESDRHKDDTRGQIKCPKCHQPMVAHLYKSCKLVTIDECYTCGSFYLDSGELEVIRGNFIGEKEREEYLNQLLAARSNYFCAVEKLNKDKGSVGRGAVQRAEAAAKLVKVLGDKFRK